MDFRIYFKPGADLWSFDRKQFHEDIGGNSRGAGFDQERNRFYWDHCIYKSDSTLDGLRSRLSKYTVIESIEDRSENSKRTI